MNKIALFHHHFCVGFDMWYKRLYVNERTKRITYSFESLKLEWGYGKLWCNVDWCVCVCCGTECGTLCNVERGGVWAVTRRDTW